MKYALFRYLDQLATDRWAWRGVRTLLRAAWIGVCVWCIGLGGHLAWGWPLRLEVLGALALAIIGVAVGLLLRPKLRPREAARRLDRRFQLNEQLATAVEVAATNPPPGSIGAHLIAQSGQTAGILRQRIVRLQRPPWTELIALIAIGLVALGLMVLVGIGRPALPSVGQPLPPLASAVDPAQQFPQEPQANQQPGQAPGQSGQPGPGAEAGDSNVAGQPVQAGDPQTLQALADALRDQGATRPAADALDRGDISGAAQELRELADRADELSQSARNDLADSLNNAADQIEERNPALADQLRESADGLEDGGQEASEALDDLAEAIEQLRNDPQAGQAQGEQPGQGQQGQQGQEGQQGQGAQEGQQGQEGQGQQGQGGQPGGAGNSAAGDQRQASQPGRLGVEGQPLELEANGPGEVPAQPSGQPPTSSSTAPGFTRGGGSGDNQRIQTGADPLRVPLDERDVVQGYFTP